MNHEESDLREYHSELLRETARDAEQLQTAPNIVFLERALQAVFDIEGIEAEPTPFWDEVGRKKLRLDAYALDAQSEKDSTTLTLLIADYDNTPSPQTIDQKAQSLFRTQALNFVEKCADSSFAAERIDYTNSAMTMAETIHRVLPHIRKIRFILFTSRINSSRSDGEAVESWQGRTVTHTVWDLKRLQQAEQDADVEPIQLELEEYGQSLEALPAHASSDDYQAYMLVIPGEMLARIYDRWEGRLLEQNVRVFLQARGKVNQGIRDTIAKEPHMFLAFNNGITATAEHVDFDKDTKKILRIDNLQIVNGGQTTASIHAAFLNKRDLSQVFVPMKLSIIQPKNVEKIVPRISEYANTQNKVSAADFFSNHPYHQKIEKFSRKTAVPSATSKNVATKWFYERARGQYNVDKGLAKKKGPRQLKAFEAEFPKSQLFTKTDLAKFLTVWDQKPHEVSLGAQKVFAKFAKTIADGWTSNSEQFNKDYYQEAVAKAIVFKHTEKEVTRQPWYQSGFRANIVAYAIARVASEAQKNKYHVDFKQIWKDQNVSEEMSAALMVAAQAATEIIYDAPSEVKNPTEWAKKEACWQRLRERKLEFPELWYYELLSDEEQNERIEEVKENAAIESEIGVAEILVSGEWPTEHWTSLLAFTRDKRLIKSFDENSLKAAISFADTQTAIPTDRQLKSIAATLHKARSLGWEPNN